MPGRGEVLDYASLLAAHGGIKPAARAAGRDPGAFRRGLRRQRARAGAEGRAADAPAVPPVPAALDTPTPIVVGAPADGAAAPAAEPRDPVEIRREQILIRDQAATIRRLEQRVIGLQDDYDRVVRISRTRLDTLGWVPAPYVSSGTTLLPLLFTSDFQCGEVIDADELDGINAYDKDVFAERYQRLVDKSVDLARRHTGASDFAGCIYARGGDAISGGIHDELADTDDLTSVEAVRWLVRHEREGIRRLKAEFGRVHVVSIPGNHGRTTEERRSKGYVRHSYETLISWWLQSHFDDDPAVTFYMPPSGDAYFDALGWKVLMSHGDRMGSRGGQGFIGPAATIARGHKKLYDTWTLTGHPVHLILTGHLHTSLKLELGYANGSLAGYSEFARDLRATPDAAKQWLLCFHEARRVSHAFEVQVSDPPRRTVHVDPVRLAAAGWA